MPIRELIYEKLRERVEHCHPELTLILMDDEAGNYTEEVMAVLLENSTLSHEWCEATEDWVERRLVDVGEVC